MKLLVLSWYSKDGLVESLHDVMCVILRDCRLMYVGDRLYGIVIEYRVIGIVVLLLVHSYVMRAISVIGVIVIVLGLLVTSTS